VVRIAHALAVSRFRTFVAIAAHCFGVDTLSL
jgi:hypothetical protein